ncbi:MAG: DUF2339 domain-containing protein [Dokdonella sp.]
MGFMIVIACCFAGMVIGGMSGSDAMVTAGFFFGLAGGLMLVHVRKLSARIDALRGDVDALRQVQRAESAPLPRASREDVAPSATASKPSVPTRTSAPPVPDWTAPVLDLRFDEASSAMPPVAPIPSAAPRPPTTPTTPRRVIVPPRRPSSPDPFDRAIAWVKRWFSEGNVPVKVGMLVLFAGVAALLKYASDQGWLTLPIELRIAGIALAAIAALVFGWRERARRRSFGLSLQGGAIGVLLMTVFASFRLYHLLPPAAAFALMLILVAGTGVLAVLQDALALAVLGILAGFAAPILISTGSGDHVVLFSYYALLNLAIFAIAWVRPWRALNLLGFVFTFAIGTAWGVLSYHSELFASTEPFLLIYFAIYLAVPILYARKREPTQRDIVDGSLVFGNPLLAFALHAALLNGERMPLAYSALALAAIYALLAWQLVRRERMRVLGEAFAVLGVGFATLAVPLALSARSTACTFALEGAALVWLGLRQQRVLPQVSGWLLQALAALAFLAAIAFGAQGSEATPIANSFFISAVLIAAAAFVSAWLYARAGTRTPLGLLMYLWGLAWWLGAGLHEIDRFVPEPLHAEALLAFSALTAALAAIAFARTLSGATAWSCAVTLAVGVALVFLFADVGARPFAGWGLAAFATYAVSGYFTLHALREARGLVPALAQMSWLWTWTFAFALALRQFGMDGHLGAGWLDALTTLPLLAAWAITLVRPQWIAPPLARRFDEYRGVLLGLQAMVVTCTFVLLLREAGDNMPLPFIPILNPVELVQLGALACAARWLIDSAAPDELARRRGVVLAIAGFAFITVATLRAAHQLGGVAWDAQLWDSNLAQTSLTMVWSVLGVIGWVLGSRRSQRVLWLAGALLMGVVLAKLLLVDRTHLGNLFGIVSFIAYGLLCTVIGYFAPAPPRSTETPDGAAT